ncbi:MAG: acetyl-CoA carboxylase carboxyl transferase subunit beta [Candidatus Meridianibacter frigidus]|nr:MAG: acetyl-CoA carboxylase carboxyl transferase subunit beta [Candidatus Eremiobacteraeota bacterium]
MAMPEWLRRRRSKHENGEEAGTWTKCPKCQEVIYRKDLVENLSVCPRCHYHFRMHAFDRISLIVDNDFAEVGGDILPGDPLEWIDKKSYPQKLAADREKSQLTEGVICGFGTLAGFPIALGVMDFNFRGGTMGTVVGERITILLESARERRLPCIIFTASGGARMEEGMLALMQMAKITSAVTRFMEDGNLFVTVLTDPTTGGVSASFAFQSDVVVAEAKAMIGFAGRRVIEQTIRQKLPENFQTAEFLLEKGHVDMVVERAEMKPALARILDYSLGGHEVAS